MFRFIRPTRNAHTARRAKPRSGKLGMALKFAPLALTLLTQYRQMQRQKRGKHAKLRRRDRALDFVLDRADRRFGAAQMWGGPAGSHRKGRRR